MVQIAFLALLITSETPVIVAEAAKSATSGRPITSPARYSDRWHLSRSSFGSSPSLSSSHKLQLWLQSP